MLLYSVRKLPFMSRALTISLLIYFRSGTMKISNCVVLLGVVISSEALLKSLIRGGKNVTKKGVLYGASGAAIGAGAANSVVQSGTKLFSKTANKTAEISNNLLTGATAISGLALVTSATYANKGLGVAENVAGNVPLVGGAIKIGAGVAKKSVSSVNLVGQSSLSAVDNVGTATVGLTNRVAQIGAKGTSGSVAIGTGIFQGGMVLGATAANTGVDLTANAAEKVVNQLSRNTTTTEETETDESVAEILANNLADVWEKIAPQISRTIESRFLLSRMSDITVGRILVLVKFYELMWARKVPDGWISRQH